MKVKKSLALMIIVVLFAATEVAARPKPGFLDARDDWLLNEKYVISHSALHVIVQAHGSSFFNFRSLSSFRQRDSAANVE